MAPLPRCVDRRAPARVASVMSRVSALACPSETTICCSTNLSMNRIAPSISGASVTSRMRPSAASWKRQNSSQLGGLTCSSGWAPRGPSTAEM